MEEHSRLLDHIWKRQFSEIAVEYILKNNEVSSKMLLTPKFKYEQMGKDEMSSMIWTRTCSKFSVASMSVEYDGMFYTRQGFELLI